MSEAADVTFAASYPGQLVAIRNAVAGGGTPPQRLPNSQVPQYVRLSELPPEMGEIDLIFRPSDLYLMGYRTSSGTFTFSNVSAVQGSTSTGFGDEYKDMGIDRDSWVTVSMHDIETTLWTIAYSPTAASATQMGHLVVGFCEASRFADIERSVIDGAPFDGKLLKWASAKRAASDLLLQPA